MNITDNLANEIKQHLHYNLDLHIQKTVSSTNTVLKEKGADGAPHGTVLIASEQTSGRGRMGKKFYSPSGSGVYLSILLRPDIPANEALFLTTSASVAVSKAIEDVSDKKPGIKWVNDIYIDTKKVCGILTESSFNIETGKLNYVVVGIGINLYSPKNGFPEDVDYIAATLFNDKKEALRKRGLLIANIFNYFMEYYNDFKDKSYVEEYINRSTLIGKEITVIDGSKTQDAVALEIDKECRLKVKLDNGDERWLNSGDVSIKVHRPDTE